MIKKITIVLYILVVVTLATTTIIENIYDMAFANRYIYGSWWFCLLWGLLTASGMAYIIKTKIRKWNILLLHISFIIILWGALLTHITSFKGIVHIRGDQPTNIYIEMDNSSEGETKVLPFYIKLEHFNIINHTGTSAAADYITHFSILDGARTTQAQVSMNHIFNYKGVRFYQASYDTDNMGSYLNVNSDPYGITVTYTGYALLFFSLIWLLINPKGTFRKLLQNPLLKEAALSIALLFPIGGNSFFNSNDSYVETKAATVLPQETAHKFGKLFINYNNRICPIQTFALDFTKKISGKRTYENADAEQVLMSWIFYADEWNSEPLIHIKNNEMKSRFNIGEYANVKSFFHNGEYILGPYLMEYQEGQQDGFHKACAEIDNKLQIIMSLQQGQTLVLFPHTFSNGQTQWFSPFEKYPKELCRADILFIKNVFPLIYGQIVHGNYEAVDKILDKTLQYQKKNAGNSLPSEIQVKAECLYNTIPFATILFMLNLTLGIFALFITIRGIALNKTQIFGISHSKICYMLGSILLLSYGALTLALALRWITSGNVPLANGYESMLCVAWFTMAFTLVSSFFIKQKSILIFSFGFLISGFFLLVSHISQMDPAIGQIMPVLNSPLLSIHVSIIMMSYALLALTFICGLTALILTGLHKLKFAHKKDSTKYDYHIQQESLRILSLIFLYPAITTMGLGIFIGAIWANISWGTYWSWDPKETWALITFLIYSIVLHTKSLPCFKKPAIFHIYITLAFLSILMTFFGVNYLLGGMHSYA